MIEAPTLDNESQRAEALDAAMCAFVPREERFDRITRTVKRLLDVPLARPRKRLELAANPTYLKCRQRVLEFLYERHRFVEAA
mgnify:CR=1 FL=1